MAKTKDDLLRELEEVASEVFKDIDPDKVTKAELEELIVIARSGATIPDPAPDGDTPAELPWEKWGVKEADREIVSLALEASGLKGPDEVFVVKVLGPKQVRIISVSGKRYPFIDVRPDKE